MEIFQQVVDIISQLLDIISRFLNSLNFLDPAWGG